MRFWTRASATGRPSLPTSSVGAAVAVAVARPPATRAWYVDVWIQMLRKKPLGTIGGAIVVVMLAAAVLADLVAPYGEVGDEFHRVDRRLLRHEAKRYG